MSDCPLARRLVRRFRIQSGESPPGDIEEKARLHLLDAIGVGLAAMGTKVGEPYRRYAARIPTGGPAAILGWSEGAASADAALVNGGLIHSLEYDDTHTGSIAHGSAVLAAAALAAGEGAGASGAAVLRSYALGWETLIRVGLASPGNFQARGFQITSTGGALVAALMSAGLYGLSEDESVAAIGIALSGASGVFEFLTNGSSVKSMHPGWAAHTGITAALLAASGLTGPETSLEGRFGLFRTFAGDEAGAAAFEASLPDLGYTWRLAEAAFKFHPCCHYLHPFIEAAGQLAAAGITPDSVRSLLCRVPAGAAPIICEPWSGKQAPASGHAARWSLPVTVAARLVHGTVDLDTFDAPPDEAVRALAARIRWEPLAQDCFPQAFEGEITCETQDGAVQVVRIDDVFGNRSRPASPSQVRAKFRANAAKVLASEGVAALEHEIDGLIGARTLAGLQAAIRTERPSVERSAA
jgi:2-methylcitrate dehydratase PrpD